MKGLLDYKRDCARLTQATFVKQFTAPFLLWENTAKPDKEPVFVTRIMNPAAIMAASKAWPAPFEMATTQVIKIEKRPDHPYRSKVFVGRAPTNDIIIDALAVSKVHAYFTYDEAGHIWSITDVGSRNGVFVNQDQLTPKTPAPLADGTAIRFGTSAVFYFVLPITLYRILGANGALARA